MNENGLSILLQIVIVSVLVGILGWERERAGKGAGLRTHILVGAASTLFIVIGKSMAKDRIADKPEINSRALRPL